MSDTLTYHPIVEMFPAMSAEERAALRSDIAANGVRVPVLVWQGQIIDGRNRIEIADELGIDCPIEEVRGTEAEAVAHAVGLNMHRRHLSSSQRAALSVVLKLDEQAQAIHPDAGVEEIARMLGTNRESLRVARKLRDEDSELLQQVIAGSIKLHDAAKILERRQDERVGKQRNEAGGDGGAADNNGQPRPERVPPVPTDELGNPLPGHLVGVFAIRPDFEKLAMLIADAEKGVKRLSGSLAGEFLERGMDGLTATLRGAKKDVMAAAPHCVCPGCMGDGCEQCRQIGWLSRSVYDLLPADQQAKLLLNQGE